MMMNEQRLTPTEWASGQPATRPGVLNFESTAKADRSDALLVMISHPGRRLPGESFRIASGCAIVIGRSLRATVSLPHVESVSRIHACLIHDGTEVTIEDCSSTNGTLVNEESVVGPMKLRGGDRIQIGDVLFKLLRSGDIECAYHEEVFEMVRRDALTGVFNRRMFDDRCEREVSRSVRYERPLSLLLIDLDEFKQVNDQHGHSAGDRLLVHVAKIISAEVRADDLVARVGGDEFAVVCPESPNKNAQGLAKRIQVAVSKSALIEDGVAINPSCTVGVASLGTTVQSSRELYDGADRQLYQRKRGRRHD